MSVPQPGWQSAALPRPKIRMPWYVWLLIITTVVACGLGQFGPAFVKLASSDTARGSVERDPGDAPSDPCGLIPEETVALAVPAAEVERSEADNSFEYTRYAHCDLETDDETATSTARAALSIDIERNGPFLDDSPSQSARDDFIDAKKYDLDDGPVYDVAGVGDAAYFTAESLGEDRVSIVLEVLSGPDTMRLHYVSSPTNRELAVAAVVVVARSLVKGLRR